MEMDQMECICGEILKGEKGKSQLAEQYKEHMLRSDHKVNPEQWTEAAIRIDKAKETAKKSA